MNRMMTPEFEAMMREESQRRNLSRSAPVFAELDASREVERVLIAALSLSLGQLRFAKATAALRGIRSTQFDSAIKTAVDALAVAETPEGYAAYKGAGPELDFQFLKPTPAHLEMYGRELRGIPLAKTIVHPDRVSSDLAAEQAHAREVEDVCDTCGARTFSGICSAHCDTGGF